MARRVTTTALTLIGMIALVYCGVLLALWRFQERIVFQPPASPESLERGARRLEYASSDDVRLVAHVVEPTGPHRTVVIAFHGNAMIARWMIPWAREVSRRFDAIVVLPEYRGYDGLEGLPTYDGAGRDAAAALAATMKQYGVSSSEVVYYGHSLGTAVAAELASSAPPRTLILESPFTSAREMALRWPVIGLGFFWPRISRVHYDTDRRVREIEAPVHVAHGERDIIIPARMGRAVHAAARRKGQLLMLADADHNDVATAGGEAYWRWFGEALRASPR
jgi:uncharacterized protein